MAQGVSGRAEAMAHGVSGRAEAMALGPYAMTEGQIFSGPIYQSISILLYDHPAHFDRKVGIYIETKLFQFASRALFI